MTNKTGKVLIFVPVSFQFIETLFSFIENRLIFHIVHPDYNFYSSRGVPPHLPSLLDRLQFCLSLEKYSLLRQSNQT